MNRSYTVYKQEVHEQCVWVREQKKWVREQEEWVREQEWVRE